MLSSNYDRIYEMAEKYKQSRGLRTYGYVYIFANQADGWSKELGNACGRVPGSIAINRRGDMWEAYGGNEYNGAASWVSIDKARLDSIIELWKAVSPVKEGTLFLNDDQRMDIKWENKFSSNIEIYRGISAGTILEICFDGVWLAGRMEFTHSKHEWYFRIPDQKDVSQAEMLGQPARIDALSF